MRLYDSDHLPNYILRLATLEDAYEIWNVMNQCSQALEHKEHFICDNLEYVKDILSGHGFGVVACDSHGKIVGNLLVKYPGAHEENLGYDVFLKAEDHLNDNISHSSAPKILQDISLHFEKNTIPSVSFTPENTLKHDILLTTENLMQVIHMDSASVLPEHRGHHLESHMITFAETLIDTSKYIYSFATVAPKNTASLKSLERNGYQVMVTKEKYGGVIRCVMMKILV